MPEFIFKRTDELNDSELLQATGLFNAVFDKSRSADDMLRQYVNNPLGYSFHSLIVDGGRVVGMNGYVPVYYIVRGERMLFAVSVDACVEKGYRGYFNFNHMVLTAYSHLKKAGVKFIYAYPNDNSYPIYIRSRLMEDIGMMDTYCLPYRIGGVKPALKWLNPLSRTLTRLFVSASGILARDKVAEFSVCKELASYNATRYKRGDGKYTVTGNDRDGFAYKVMEYEGIRCAFLIDVWPKSPRSFNRAVSHILKVERKAFDLLLYPGHLPFGNTGLIKLPLSMNPKKFHFTGKILDPTLKKEDVFSIEAWDTNFSNYDLI